MPPFISEEDFLECCKRVLGSEQLAAMQTLRFSMPRIADAAAKECFLRAISGPTSEGIRSALLYLDEFGRWPWSDPR